MIDLNRIRSVKTLETMRSDLNVFITNPDCRQVYLEDYGWGDEDYEADVELAKESLERVERRIKSLNRLATRQDSHCTEKSETTALTSV